MKNREGKEKQRREKGGRLWPILLCLFLAGAVFVLLLSVEEKQLSQYEKGYVVVAVSDIAANTEIVKEEVHTYLALEERPLEDIPEAAFRELEGLEGNYVQGKIDAGSILTKSMLGELRPEAEGYVLLGVDMEGLSQSVAGTLRAGDLIDIYGVESESDEKVLVEKVLGGVTIERSYTNAGVAIQKEDTTSIAQYITIPVHKDAVDTFYRSLEERRIEIVKHPQ